VGKLPYVNLPSTGGILPPAEGKPTEVIYPLWRVKYPVKRVNYQRLYYPLIIYPLQRVKYPVQRVYYEMLNYTLCRVYFTLYRG